ncbi:hypothetical protein Patl1_27961 [Pistacia atlantica]|uniref:Uncharacterized protein n=1 Tax=Pistacia atlantica TaxID=434234 RepID=A0ACC1BBS0_9ROSI|nr:hypothetical protein Patl1_27961 [Pistacia atlantica]
MKLKLECKVKTVKFEVFSAVELLSWQLLSRKTMKLKLECRVKTVKLSAMYLPNVWRAYMSNWVVQSNYGIIVKVLRTVSLSNTAVNQNEVVQNEVVICSAVVLYASRIIE